MRESGTSYRRHAVVGNTLGSVKVTANAREELHQQFKKNGGDVYCVLTYNDKQEGYNFQFHSKSPSIRHKVVEVPKHTKRWMITCSEDIFDIIKYRTLDIRLTHDGWILFPLKWR